jgi:hypothetical protein
MQDFINKFWERTVAPSLRKIINENKDNSERIVSTLNEISNEDITSAQEDTTKAVEEVQSTIKGVQETIESISYEPIQKKLDTLIQTVQEKDLSVSVGETIIDTKGIIKSIQELKKTIPSLPKQIDYTNSFEKLLTAFAEYSYKDDEKESKSSHRTLVEQLLSRLATTQDIAILAEWLRVISEKEEIDYPFKFSDKGRLLIEVDRVGGGGGGGLVRSESEALVSIPEKLEDVTHLDTHTNESSLAVIGRNHYCESNSSSTPLAGGAEFTGAWHDFNGYAELTVSVYADKDSATNGLIIEHSNDETESKVVKDTDTFSVYANAGTPFRITPGFKYVRVRYINGAVAQTKFSLQSVFRVFMTAGSTHRADESIKDNSDAPLSINVLKLKKPNANEWVSAQATTSGNFKVSIEEYESGANPVRTDIEGGGAVTIGTTAVNLTFTGTTHSIILTASQSNTGIIYIGKSTVTSAGANALTFLMPGESLTLDYNDTTNALYAVSDTASQSLFKGATL